MSDGQRAGRERPWPPQLVLVLGVLAVSTSSTLIRLAQVGTTSLAVAAWRLMLASLALAPFALTVGWAELRSLNRREWGLALASGVLLAIHFGAWIQSLAMTSVAASVVLVNTSPLFVAVIAYVLLREALSRRIAAGIVLAIAGSIVIGVGDAGGAHQLAGDLLALLGAVSVAGYLLIGRALRARLSLLGYIFPVYGAAAVLLLVAALVTGAPLAGFPPATWLWLALLALVPQIIGHSSLNWALRHLPVIYVSLSTLAEPIGSTLLAWQLLGETPAAASVAGGALILAGLVVAGQPATRRKS
ncbi:MAG: DMT family transporter [Anaerolineae bacterium]|nr:DMT family transporter [Anaerolineae bacterium]